MKSMFAHLRIWHLVVLLSVLCLMFLLSCGRTASPPPGGRVLKSMTAFVGGKFDASGVADVVSQVAPAVVTIHSQSRVRSPQQYPFMDDPSFRDFFGQRGSTPQPPPEQRRTGLLLTDEDEALTMFTALNIDSKVAREGLDILEQFL